MGWMVLSTLSCLACMIAPFVGLRYTVLYMQADFFLLGVLATILLLMATKIFHDLATMSLYGVDVADRLERGG